MEPLFVRRIQHEVDIYNHIGQVQHFTLALTLMLSCLEKMK